MATKTLCQTCRSRIRVYIQNPRSIVLACECNKLAVDMPDLWPATWVRKNKPKEKDVIQ